MADTLPDGALVSIFGRFCDSPMTALAFACASKECARAMEQAWPQLLSEWSKRWGVDEDYLSIMKRKDDGRKSKRLCEKDYYSNRKKFIRLVETGAIHAAHVHAEIFTYSCEKRTLTPLKLQETLSHWVPVWVNCGGFGRELGSSSILVEALRSRAVTARHARAIAELLVREWGADVHTPYGDGMRPIAVAAARGFPGAVKFFLSRGASLILRSNGTFMVKKRSIKGNMTPHEWACAMYAAEIASGTKESELMHLKQCIELTRPTPTMDPIVLKQNVLKFIQ